MKIAVFATALVFLAGACQSGKVSHPGNLNPETHMDSISYALGQDLANNLKRSDVAVNPEAFYEGLNAILNESGDRTLDDAQVQQMLAALQQEIRAKAMAEQQAAEAQRKASSPVQVGAPAPEITLQTPEGETVNLSDLRGKVVLVDFWASWCKPCRLENPNVVKVYNKYKNQGFEILGVSLDRTKADWVKAVDQDQLEWLHVSDLKFWQSAAAQTYGVSAIPYTVLVDKDGTILAERLRGGSLEAKLAEIFGS